MAREASASQTQDCKKRTNGNSQLRRRFRPGKRIPQRACQSERGRKWPFYFGAAPRGDGWFQGIGGTREMLGGARPEAHPRRPAPSAPSRVVPSCSDVWISRCKKYSAFLYRRRIDSTARGLYLFPRPVSCVFRPEPPARGSIRAFHGRNTTNVTSLLSKGQPQTRRFLFHICLKRQLFRLEYETIHTQVLFFHEVSVCLMILVFKPWKGKSTGLKTNKREMTMKSTTVWTCVSQPLTGVSGASAPIEDGWGRKGGWGGENRKTKP